MAAVSVARGRVGIRGEVRLRRSGGRRWVVEHERALRVERLFRRLATRKRGSRGGFWTSLVFDLRVRSKIWRRADRRSFLFGPRLRVLERRRRRRTRLIAFEVPFESLVLLLFVLRRKVLISPVHDVLDARTRFFVPLQRFP